MAPRSPSLTPHLPRLALVSALALTGSDALADADKKACIDAYERAQELRRDGKLIEARGALVTCSQAGCPAAATADCGPWLTQVEASLPSVVIGARDASGHEVLDVRVLVDGQLLLPALAGKSVPVDPGVHTFRFEPSAGAAVEERVSILEGEKNRKLTVTFGAPPAASTAGAGLSSAPPAPADGSPVRPVPTLAWGLFGLGLAGLAVFTVAGAVSLGDESDLRDTCAPRCAEDDVSAIRVKHVVADIGLGVGVASLGVATWLYVTRPVVAKAPGGGRRAVHLVVLPSAGGAAAGLGGVF